MLKMIDSSGNILTLNNFIHPEPPAYIRLAYTQLKDKIRSSVQLFYRLADMFVE